MKYQREKLVAKQYVLYYLKVFSFIDYEVVRKCSLYHSGLIESEEILEEEIYKQFERFAEQLNREIQKGRRSL